MTNREFIFTELFIIGHEHKYGPIFLGYEKHNISLIDIKFGFSKAINEVCYNPLKQFEKGLKILESYGVLKIFKESPLYIEIAFVNDPDKWEKFFNDVPKKHQRRMKKIISGT